VGKPFKPGIKDRIFPGNDGCLCTGSNGQLKNLYRTEANADEERQKSLEKRGVRLKKYPCPTGKGWHLSKM